VSEAEVRGYYERSKLWNEEAPVPHTMMMRLLANNAIRLAPEADAHLRIAEVGSLPGREAASVLGGAIYYHIEDEHAPDDVLFHDILSGPLPEHYGVVVAGLLLQEFDQPDDLLLAIKHLSQSASYLVVSYFSELLHGVWQADTILPPGMVRPTTIRGHLQDVASCVERIDMEWAARHEYVEDAYLKYARNGNKMRDPREWKYTYGTTDDEGYRIKLAFETWRIK
jgi:hypothetical protein